MNVRSYSDLAHLLRNNTQSLSDKFDLIVGVPRSGLLVALMLGMAWNVPVTDVKGALKSRLISKGRTTTRHLDELNIDFDLKNLKILIVDDSCHTGKSITEAFEEINNKFNLAITKSLCCYVSPQSRHKVDYYFEILNPHHVFEWNISRNIILEDACVDIDGVLCPDPPYCESKEKNLYLEYIKTAPVLMKPDRKIKYLVTNRLESTRKETEDWLKQNQIQYHELIMHPAKTAFERSQRDSHWHKASFFKKSDTKFFIESDSQQAYEIYLKSGKPVMCYENFAFPSGQKELYAKGMSSFLLRSIKKLAPYLDSFGRNGGLFGYLRKKLVKLLKKHVA